MTDMVSAPYRLRLGLRAVPSDECWLELDEGRERDLALKRVLLRDHYEQVLVETPDSRPAQREALERVSSTLHRFHPGRIPPDAPRRGRP